MKLINNILTNYLFRYFPFDNIYSLSLVNRKWNETCKLYFHKVYVYNFKYKLKCQLMSKSKDSVYVEYFGLKSPDGSLEKGSIYETTFYTYEGEYYLKFPKFSIVKDKIKPYKWLKSDQCYTELHVYIKFYF